MDQTTIDGLFGELRRQAQLGDEVNREPVRAWVLSGVERIHLTGGSTLFFKHATAPLTDEARVLRHVARYHLPVPRVVAAVERPDALGMLLDDLGPELRPPSILDAAQAAAATHRMPTPDGLAVLDEAAMADLPTNCLTSLAGLWASGRWDGTRDIAEQLRGLQDVAADRAHSTELPPWGLCHSEFHPTSVHISANGWQLLDWARAFQGPGLLDLASWQNTTEPPNLTSFDHLLDAYVSAGGPSEARTPRGGLPPARWAFGWHRLWVIDWYLQEATTWIADPNADAAFERAVRRHVDEAVNCLRPDVS